MKKILCISWILAGVVTLLVMTQFPAMAADKVVVIPLFSQVSGDEVPTVKSKTGRIWMDRNLGAIRVAGSKSDSLAYGWLYQWGRPADGHESRTSPVTAVNDWSNSDVPGHGNFIRVNASPYDWVTPQNNKLWDGINGMNNPCPPGFRVPTVSEWQSEIATWITMDDDGAFTSSLRLPLAGSRTHPEGDVYDIGEFGLFWASDPVGDQSRLLQIQNTSAGVVQARRAMANSVRCIKD